MAGLTTGGRLEGGDAFVDDEFVDGDVEGEAEFAEAFAPLAGEVVVVAAAEEVVPDVLRLPEVDLHGQGAEAFGDGEGFVEHGEVLRGLCSAAASRRTMARFMRLSAV